MKKKRKKRDLLRFVRKLGVIPIALALLLFMNMSALSKMGQVHKTVTPHRYVQMKDGSTIEVKSLPGSYRSEVVVSRFVSDVVNLGFKWDRTKKDIEGSGFLYPVGYDAAALWFGSSARDQWANDYYARYGPGLVGTESGVNRRDFDYYPFLTQAPIVTPVREGVWNVEVRAMHLIVNRAGQIIAKNRLGFEFVIQAINPSPSSYWSTEDPELAKLLENLWSDGLMVSDYTNLGG